MIISVTEHTGNTRTEITYYNVVAVRMVSDGHSWVLCRLYEYEGVLASFTVSPNLSVTIKDENDDG